MYKHSVMVPNGYLLRSEETLNATFGALADPTRRAILARLIEGEASVVELAAPFEMSQPAISKHLRVLERAGLIAIGRDAQRRPRRLEARPLGEAAEWLEGYRQFWEASYQRLDALLGETRPRTGSDAPPPSQSSSKFGRSGGRSGRRSRKLGLGKKTK